MYYLADFYSTDETWFDRHSIDNTSDESTEMFNELSG